MRHRLLGCFLMAAAVVSAQTTNPSTAGDKHPNLSGVWNGAAGVRVLASGERK